MNHKFAIDSLTVKINQLAQEKAQKEKVYNFAAGDPLIACSPDIITAARETLEQEYHLYPPSQGLKELRLAACTWVNESYGCKYQPSECLVTCGGKKALFLSLLAILQPGDEVLIAAPFWVSYPAIVNIIGARPVIVPTLEKNHWKLQKENLERAVSPQTKCLILNNAGNPTGVLYTESELEEILDWCASHQIMVISDEVYSEMAYGPQKFISCGQFLKYRNSVLVIQSCSKNFCMTGWRVGFVFGSQEWIQKINILQAQTITAVSLICQKAALGALMNWRAISQNIRIEMQKRRDLFHGWFNRLFQARIEAPHSSFYFFISMKSLGLSHQNSALFCEKLLQQYNVAAIPGLAFGVEGYIRMSFGGLERDIVEGLQALANACHALKDPP
jgi:aspartate aminotransferase